MAFVSLSDVCKSYGSVPAVQNFTLEIEKGQFVVLVGPSGCGKSTVLKMIAGLEAITSGEVNIDDRIVNDVDPKDRDIAMVFQNYALYPDKTVYDNMAFGLKMRKVPADEIDERVGAASQILGIGELLERRPAQLSGGQRQRVAVGRVIVRDPKVFLFDEPLSNLDAHLRGRMRKELIKLHKQLGATMIYVTHDQIEAMTMGDVIVVMRDCRIQQFGSPLDVFERPANQFVASFIGAPPMNMIEGRLSLDRSPHLLTGGVSIALPEKMTLPLADYNGGEIVFGIRPQHIGLTPASAKKGDELYGTIGLLEQLGTESAIDLEVGTNALAVNLPPTPGLKEGDQMRIELDFTRAHYFDQRSEGIICHGIDHMTGP
jgi:ABC-type sugar transport system ATPase subunit|tara:strand:+ start:11038 stop:12156 length:1119 start_codon:yes stop_codon:yes gene_type:complete